MSDLATLGIAVDSSPAAKAATDLDKMTASAERAEDAVVGMGEKSSEALKEVGRGVAGLPGTLKEVETSATGAGRAASGMVSSQLINQMKQFEASLKTGAASTAELEMQRSSLRTLQKANMIDDAEAIKINQALERSQKALISSAAREEAAFQRLMAQIDPSSAALMRLDRHVELLGKSFDAGRLTQEKYSTALEQLEKRYMSAEKGLHKTADALDGAGRSAKQMANAFRQLPARFTDMFTSLVAGQNPLWVLIQQGGQIKDSFGGIGPMFDVLGAKAKSMYGAVASGIGGFGSFGGVLGDLASQQQAVADGADIAGEGLGGMAEGANTAADASKNAKEAAAALGLTGVPVSAGLGLIVGAAAAAAAAIGLLIYGYNKGSQEADVYSKALILTGNAAGATSSQLAGMARRVGDATTTVGDAAAVLATLAESGKIPVEAFEKIATAALNLEDATGKAAATTAAEFVTIAENPTKALATLSEKYGVVTAATYEQVRALQENGDKQAAAVIAEDAYASALEIRSVKIKENLGAVEFAWDGISSAAKKGWDAILDVGRDQSIDEQIANTVEILNKRKTGFQAWLFDSENGERSTRFLEDKLKLLTKVKGATEDQAKKEGDAIKLHREGQESYERHQQRVEANFTKIQKMNKALEKEQQDINKARLAGYTITAEQEAASLKAIRENSIYKEAEARKAKAYTESAGIRMLDQARQHYAVLKEQAGLIGTQEKGVSALGAEAKKLIELEQQIADIKTKKTLTADQKSILAMAVLNLDQQERNANLEREVELKKQSLEEIRKLAAFQKNLNNQLDLAKEGLSNQLAGAGMGSELRKRLQEDMKLRQDYQKQLNNLTKSFNESDRDKFPQDRYDKETAMIKAALAERLTLQDGYYRQYDQDQADWSLGVSEAWRNYVSEAASTAKMTESAFSNAFDGLEDVFVDFITTGKASFKDFADSVLADLARIVVKQQIMAPLLQSMFGGTPSGGSFGQSAGQMFGGGTGSGFTDALSMGQKAIGLYNSGAGQAFMSGFQSGTGVIGSLSSGLGAGYASLSGAITGNTAAIGSMQAGYTGSAMANWSAGQAASSAGASAGASAAGAGVSALGAVGYGIGGAISGYQQAGMKGAVTGAGGAVAGAYAGAALGSVVPIIGNVIGAAIGAIIGGMVGGSVWGGEWITKDQGLSLGITGGGLDVSGYEDQSKKGGMFGKNKKRTTLTALDPGMQSVLDQSYAAVQDNVFSLFDRLNIELTDGVLDGMNIAAGKMSTKGMSSQEIQDALTKWFGGVADFMTVAVANATGSGTAGYDFAALTEFVNNLYGVNDVIKYLNVGLFEMSVQGGFMAEQLSAMAGGFEAMKASAASYYDGFYTDVEKADHTLAAVNEQFKAMNITLPETRKGYRDMVEALDLTTEYGRQMFVTLTGLAGSAAASFDILEQRATSANQALMQTLETAVNDAMSAVQRAANAEKNAATEAYNAQTASLNDMLETAQASMTGLKSISSALGAALKSLRGDGDEAVKMMRNQAKATVQSALSIARAGGSLSGFSGLEDALGVISDNDTSLYDSLEAFNREQGRNANLAAELNLITDQQLSADEALLRTVKDQIKVAKQQYDDEMLRLDNQLLLAQKQIDALHGVDTSVLSMANAMGKLTAAIAEMTKVNEALKPPTGSDAGSTLDSLYNELLGRDPDQAGKDYWNNWLNNGGSLGGLSDAIKNDALANGELKKYATGGLVYGPGTGTSDDVLARLSNGEYIINARATAMLGTGLLDQLNAGQLPAFAAGGPVLEVTRPSQVYSSQQTPMRQGGEGDNRELIAEVRQLREDNKQAQFQIAKNTQQLGVLLRKWDTEGAPKERDYA